MLIEAIVLLLSLCYSLASLVVGGVSQFLMWHLISLVIDLSVIGIIIFYAGYEILRVFNASYVSLIRPAWRWLREAIHHLRYVGPPKTLLTLWRDRHSLGRFRRWFNSLLTYEESQEVEELLVHCSDWDVHLPSEPVYPKVSIDDEPSTSEIEKPSDDETVFSELDVEIAENLGVPLIHFGEGPSVSIRKDDETVEEEPVGPVYGPTASFNDDVDNTKMCKRFIGIAVRAAKNRFGVPTRTAANRRCVHTFIVEWMEQHGHRPSHIARDAPIAVALTFIPSESELFAQKLVTDPNVVLRLAEWSQSEDF